MKLLFLLSVLGFTACSIASESTKTEVETQICEFDFKAQVPCLSDAVSVELRFSLVAIDEKSLQSLQVKYKGEEYLLPVTKDTSILDGDKGYILISDINFDGLVDVAVTTTFGLANLYLDYWVYDAEKKEYVFVGNYGKLKLNEAKKTLSNTIKLNAANYEMNEYNWQGNKLIKTP